MIDKTNIFSNILISICICTYRRPNLLKQLLESIVSQETERAFDYEIIIVDNDKARTAESVVILFQKSSSKLIKYAIEENKNISLARNKAIKLANGNFIAFIDDDEIPNKVWLLTLYRTLMQHNADVVMGPVFPIYQVKPPKWVIKGNFHRRPCHKSGFFDNWKMGRTGNLLIKRSIFESTNVYFDPNFGQGGEDQDLTRRLMEKGVRFFWCNKAPAYEIINPERWDLRYLIKKAILRGKMSSQYPGSKTIKLSKSILAICVYCLALPFLFFLGYHIFFSYLIKLGDHFGRTSMILFNK